MKYLIILLAVLLLLPLLAAEFTKGYPAGELELYYGRGENIRGWINISFDEEPSDSLLSIFNNNITLFEFLENTNVDYNCTPNPVNCGTVRTAVNGGTSKTLSLNAGQSSVIGLKVQGNLSGTDGVTDISFRISSDATSSCYQPLKLDFGDDNEVDWQFLNSIDDFPPCTKSRGCFDLDADLQDYIISTTQYCEKLTLPALPRFRVGGGFIAGTGSPQFEMIVHDDEMVEISSCFIPIFTTDGDKSCIVELNLTEQTDVFICLYSEFETDYKIQGESEDPKCGFYGSDSTDLTTDYNIFAEGGKYAPVGSFTIDEDRFIDYDGESLIEFLNEYLEQVYHDDCSYGCVIPIRFTSGKNQEVVLSNLDFDYDTRSGGLSENKFYNVQEQDSEINSDLIKINLEYANLPVPDSVGDYNAVLRLDGEKIVERRIDVSEGLQVIDVIPHEAPVLVSTIFLAIINETGGDITYYWDFGDGSTDITTTKGVEHTYEDFGDYDLVLRVVKGDRESSKTIRITAISPKDSIQKTIEKYEQDIIKVKGQVNRFSEWMKSDANTRLNLESLENQVNAIETRFDDIKNTSDDIGHAQIMEDLIDLKVPYNVEVGQSIPSGDFIMSKSQLDPSVLEELGAGDNDRSKDEFFNGINSWLSGNMDISVEAKTYNVYYRDGTEDTLFTHFKFFINPKFDVSSFYFMASGNPLQIKYRDTETNEVTGVAKGKIYYDMLEGDSKTIEFLHPDKVNLLNMPVYVSPDFRVLGDPLEPRDPGTGCNANGKCETERGENPTNCRSDCKPIVWTIILLVGLLFGAFVIYIVLQEWYKRHYESHLFRNKNQLWNLINFISISSNQGLKKDQIFEKLKKAGWSGEQLNYAWNKYHGKRTGMWEIPIFKSVEKKHVRRELERRRRTPGGFGRGGFTRV